MSQQQLRGQRRSNPRPSNRQSLQKAGKVISSKRESGLKSLEPLRTGGLSATVGSLRDNSDSRPDDWLGGKPSYLQLYQDDSFRKLPINRRSANPTESLCGDSVHSRPDDWLGRTPSEHSHQSQRFRKLHLEDDSWISRESSSSIRTEKIEPAVKHLSKDKHSSPPTTITIPHFHAGQKPKATNLLCGEPAPASKSAASSHRCSDNHLRPDDWLGGRPVYLQERQDSFIRSGRKQNDSMKPSFPLSYNAKSLYRQSRVSSPPTDDWLERPRRSPAYHRSERKPAVKSSSSLRCRSNHLRPDNWLGGRPE